MENTQDGRTRFLLLLFIPVFFFMALFVCILSFFSFLLFFWEGGSVQFEAEQLLKKYTEKPVIYPSKINFFCDPFLSSFFFSLCFCFCLCLFLHCKKPSLRIDDYLWEMPSVLFSRYPLQSGRGLHSLSCLFFIFFIYLCFHLFLKPLLGSALTSTSHGPKGADSVFFPLMVCFE